MEHWSKGAVEEEEERGGQVAETDLFSFNLFGSIMDPVKQVMGRMRLLV